MDVPLDELGRRQAEALGRAEVLRDASRVVSSPLMRARETAACFGRPVTVDERWTEIDYGVYDGAEADSVPDLWGRWTGDLAFVPDSGESLEALGQRVREACDELWPEAVDHDILVVTHVSPIKAAVAWALGVGDETSWRMFVDLASVTRIGVGRSGPSLRTFNETQFRPSS